MYVIGDVHGQFDKVTRLLRDAGLVGKTLTWTGGTRTLWFMGDFFDRGTDGIAVIELVMGLQNEAAAAGGRVEALLGNHEVLPLSAMIFGEQPTTGPGGNFMADWKLNGGLTTDLGKLQPRHVRWIINLPAMARVGDWLLVHADSTFYTNYGSSVDEVNDTLRTLLRRGTAAEWDRLLEEFSRRREFSNEWEDGAEQAARFLQTFGGKKLLHGHTPISRMTGQRPEDITAPFTYANGLCVNVDGGMYQGGPGFVYELQI